MWTSFFLLLSVVSLVIGQCPIPAELSLGASLTCYPPAEGNFYPEATFCISYCDYHTVQHNCLNCQWDIDINNHGCECQPLGSKRGGRFECYPHLELSSSAGEGTKCIFVCDDEPTAMTECSSRKWSKPIKEIACESGFQCPKLTNPGSGTVTCEDSFIQTGTKCSLECNDGWTGVGNDRFECLEDHEWSFGNNTYECFRAASKEGPGVLIFGGTGGGKAQAKSSFFAPSSALSESDCYRTLASLKGGPRTNAAAALLGSNVIICGGSNDQGETLDSCESYNPLLDKWTEFPAKMLTPREGAAAVVYHESLMIFGGSGGNFNITMKSEIYDSEGQIWSEGILLPSRVANSGLCAIVAEGHLYLIGGYESTYIGSTYVLEGGQWKMLDQMYLDRRHHACIYATLLGGEKGIFVTGGMPGDSLTTTEFYSFADNSWRIMAEMKSPRHGHGMVQLGDKIYAFGGTNVDSVEEYDTQLDAWKMLEDRLEGDNFKFAYVPASQCLYKP